MCWVSLPAHVDGCKMVLGQKFLDNPDPGFRRCCSVQHRHVQLLTLMALHCHKVMGHPGRLLGHPLLSSLPGVWHLPCGSQTQKDLGVQLPAFRHDVHSNWALWVVQAELWLLASSDGTEMSSDKLGWSLAALADIYPQLGKLGDAYFVKQKTVKKEILSSVCCLDILCIASII